MKGSCYLVQHGSVIAPSDETCVLQKVRYFNANSVLPNEVGILNHTLVPTPILEDNGESKMLLPNYIERFVSARAALFSISDITTSGGQMGSVCAYMEGRHPASYRCDQGGSLMGPFIQP